MARLNEINQSRSILSADKIIINETQKSDCFVTLFETKPEQVVITQKDD